MGDSKTPTGPGGAGDGSATGSGQTGQDDETTLKARVQELFDGIINPAVASHGGFIRLVDVKDKVIYVEMMGGCQGCGAADATLRAGIEQIVRQEIPEIVAISDTTDHASGANPYIQNSKG